MPSAAFPRGLVSLREALKDGPGSLADNLVAGTLTLLICGWHEPIAMERRRSQVALPRYSGDSLMGSSPSEMEYRSGWTNVGAPAAVGNE